jgi:hypothetical protein
MSRRRKNAPGTNAHAAGRGPAQQAPSAPKGDPMNTIVPVVMGALAAIAVGRWAYVVRSAPAPAPTVIAHDPVSRPSVPTRPRPPTRPIEPARPSAGREERRHASHLLVMYAGSSSAPATVTRTKEQARARAMDALRRARAGADFAALARELSDEPGATARGGDLGSFSRGMMVRPFEDAAFALAPGALSDVVETQFGFHVIKRWE